MDVKQYLHPHRLYTAPPSLPQLPTPLTGLRTSPTYLIFASMLQDLLVDNLVHDLEALHGLLFRNSHIRLLQWHWTVAVVKEEQSLGRIDAQEGGNIFVVRQSGRQTNQTHILLGCLDVF